MKNQKGITLIALVITIIVLLILAGISIVMLTGENGLLKRATEAGITAKVADAREQVSLAVNDLVSGYYEEKYTNTAAATPISESVGEYVAKTLPDELKKDQYSSYASATYDETTKDATITLVPKDKNGKTLTAVYHSATGKLDTFAAPAD